MNHAVDKDGIYDDILDNVSYTSDILFVDDVYDSVSTKIENCASDEIGSGLIDSIMDDIPRFDGEYAHRDGIKDALDYIYDSFDDYIEDGYYRINYEYDEEGRVINKICREGAELKDFTEKHFLYTDGLLAGYKIVDSKTGQLISECNFKRDAKGRIVEVKNSTPDYYVKENASYFDNDKTVTRYQELFEYGEHYRLLAICKVISNTLNRY